MAQYNRTDMFVVKQLERIVNPKIIVQIFRIDWQLPIGYDAWKETIIAIDEMWKRRKESQKAWGTSWNNWFLGSGFGRLANLTQTP